MRSISSCRGVVHSIDEGSFWSQIFRTPGEYHETGRKGIAAEEKSGRGGQRGSRPGRIFPAIGPAPSIGKYLSKHTDQERGLTHSRSSPKAILQPEPADGNEARNQNGRGMRALLREQARRTSHAANKNQSLQARCPGSGGRMGGTKSETGGTLDPKTYIIAVEKIEAEAASRGSSTRPNQYPDRQGLSARPSRTLPRPLEDRSWRIHNGLRPNRARS